VSVESFIFNLIQSKSTTRKLNREKKYEPIIITS